MHDRPAAPDGAPLSDNGYTHRQILVIFSGLLLGMLLAALDQTIVATSLRTITDDLGGRGVFGVDPRGRGTLISSINWVTPSRSDSSTVQRSSSFDQGVS